MRLAAVLLATAVLASQHRLVDFFPIDREMRVNILLGCRKYTRALCPDFKEKESRALNVFACISQHQEALSDRCYNNIVRSVKTFPAFLCSHDAVRLFPEINSTSDTITLIHHAAYTDAELLTRDCVRYLYSIPQFVCLRDREAACPNTSGTELVGCVARNMLHFSGQCQDALAMEGLEQTYGFDTMFDPPVFNTSINAGILDTVDSVDTIGTVGTADMDQEQAQRSTVHLVPVILLFGIVFAVGYVTKSMLYKSTRSNRAPEDLQMETGDDEDDLTEAELQLLGDATNE